MREDPSPPTKIDLVLASSLGGFSLLFYRLTLTPSLSYLSPDGNELATVPHLLGLAHMPGYPLYTWLGKAFTLLPFGDVAHRMNLMSATLAAPGVAGLYLIAVTLSPHRTASPTLRRAASALAALLFAFSPTFWSQAVIAEVYTPNIFMLALSLLLLLRWERTRRDRDFFFFALAFGLSLGTHISNLGFAPAMALFVLLTAPSVLKRPTWWLAALGGFGLGLAQFAWLPLRAGSLNDRLMLEHAPVTLEGFYRYTLGAFPQLKFAFPLSQIPDRVVVYLYLLKQQFGWLSMLLGVGGLITLLLRRTRHYFLLVVMYLVHVWFFIQYRAFDLEVFFLPAHFLWALFLAFGISAVFDGMENLLTRVKQGRLHVTCKWALAISAVALGLLPLLSHLPESDRSHDVAVNDFYANLWELLPADSALLTSGGVFGYDAFYWQLVYDTRPDVVLPTLPDPNPSPADLAGRELYSTTPVSGARKERRPGALPPAVLPEDLWQVPVLLGASEGLEGLGARGRLVLYHLREEPPDLVVPSASPDSEFELQYDGLTFVGVDLSPQIVESGARIHLRLYWRLSLPRRYRVSTLLDGRALESHELGFGNLRRYHSGVGSVLNGVIVEEYDLVIPSTVPPGEHSLSISLQDRGEGFEIGKITVVDQEEAMERWLRIAG